MLTISRQFMGGFIFQIIDDKWRNWAKMAHFAFTVPEVSMRTYGCVWLLAHAPHTTERVPPIACCLSRDSDIYMGFSNVRTAPSD